MVGAEVFFKCENFQRGGAFKFRGAFNAISQLDHAAKRRGIVAFSSGNHAQAVALTSRICDVHAIIVMPTDSPQAKLAATREYGVEVVLYDRHTENREEVAARFVHDQGRTLIPPFDHPQIIAGQGTAALELIADTGALDMLFTCVGGGGLASGTVLAAKHLLPACIVIGVEPEAGHDAARSLKSGHIVTIPPPDTIADEARTQSLGKLPFSILQHTIDEIIDVNDGALLGPVNTMNAARFCPDYKRFRRCSSVTTLRRCALIAPRTRMKSGQNRTTFIVLTGPSTDALFSRAYEDCR